MERSKFWSRTKDVEVSARFRVLILFAASEIGPRQLARPPLGPGEVVAGRPTGVAQMEGRPKQVVRLDGARMRSGTLVPATGGCLDVPDLLVAEPRRSTSDDR